MSADILATLHRQIASGEHEQALRTAQGLPGIRSLSLAELMAGIDHAVNARQPELATALLAEGRRFFAREDPALLQRLLEEMTTVLAACWREKQDEPARRTIGLVLELLVAPECRCPLECIPAGSRFAGLAGRYALRRNDSGLFAEIAGRTSGWAAREEAGRGGIAFLPALESWLHRMLRHERNDALPAIIGALTILYSREADKQGLLSAFLTEWKITAAAACLNPDSLLFPQLTEQLLLFADGTGNPQVWASVAGAVGEVAALAVTKAGVPDAFSVFRPLLDVGRVNLADELKFGTGPDPDSMRQKIIRLVCGETLRIADMAAHAGLMAGAGDKLEEMYRTWVADPQYETQIRSIQRFCQLLLIFWTHNRKRAAKNWSPREKSLSEPLLLTEEDQAKLTFLL